MIRQLLTSEVQRGGAHGEQWTELQPLKETMNTKEPIFDQRELLLEKSNIRSIPCYVGSLVAGVAAAICSKIACIVEPGIQNEQSHQFLKSYPLLWSLSKWILDLVFEIFWSQIPPGGLACRARHSPKSLLSSRVRVAFVAFKSQREVWQVFKSFWSWSLHSW